MKKLLFIVILGFAPFQANAGNIYDIATTCTWKSGRLDGSAYLGPVIALNLKLMPSGQIFDLNTNSVFASVGESLWAIEDGNLIFRHQNGQVSTRFTSVGIDSASGQIIFEGSYLLPFPYPVTHTLTCHS
jgi:hypothetical protein